MIKIKPLFIAILCLCNSSLLCAATPAGSVLKNQITVSFQDADGNNYTVGSNIINITIREVQAVILTAVSGSIQEVAAIPHAEIDSVHQLQNMGNMSGTYQLSAKNIVARKALAKAASGATQPSSSSNDTIDAQEILIFHDKNGNGEVDLDPDEATPITEITLAAGEVANLIVRSQLPAKVTDEDKLDITLQAIDKDNGAVTTSINKVELTFTDSNTSNLVIWNKADGGNCHAYKVIGATQALLWSKAKAEADKLIYRGVPGHLVAISNSLEQMFLYSIIDRFSHSYWLGLTRAESANSPYKWLSGELLGYTNWGVSEPSFGMHLYTLMWSGGNGKWYDKADDGDGFVKNYIVEFDTDCGKPKINTQLSAAKDVNCDGIADSDFGMVALAEMESKQCVVMDIMAVNDSGTDAQNMEITHNLKPFTQYRLESLQYCKGVKCNLESKTANGDDSDGVEIIQANEELVFNVGEMKLGEQAHARFSLVID